MALPSSGPISLNNVNVELGLSGTTSINMNQASVRTLFGVPSGAIRMSDGYGKSNEFAFAISSNQVNANLRSLATSAGWDQSTKLIATINGGVYVYSNSTGTPGLTINGSFPNGVTLVNNGYILGMGGNGSTGCSVGFTSASPGDSGGTALSVSSATTINNASGVIAGGGGGGGGGGALNEGGVGKSGPYIQYGWAAGGGGGGQTGLSNTAGGGPGGGTFGQRSRDPQAGSGGDVNGAGGGGIGGAAPNAGYYAGQGGSGGSWGSSGARGQDGRAYFYNGPPGNGGSGGSAVTGNGNITWTNTGTRYGGIS
jgi:hypothetical protein